MTTTSISVRAGRDYVKRLKKLAALQERDMADLVRDAIDQRYGDSMAQLEEFSLATVVPQTKQDSE